MNVGDRIPEILGIDQDGREIKASDYRGRKIVLYSYPKANTSGCTAEACSLQAHKEELAAAGYEIIGVSKDKQALQKKFAETKGLQFPLIADTETTLLQELGCWGEKVPAAERPSESSAPPILSTKKALLRKYSLQRRSRPRFMQSRFWITSINKPTAEWTILSSNFFC